MATASQGTEPPTAEHSESHATAPTASPETTSTPPSHTVLAPPGTTTAPPGPRPAPAGTTPPFGGASVTASPPGTAATSAATQPPPQAQGHSQGLPQRLINPTFFGEITGTDGTPYQTLRKRATDAYRLHTYQYWFVATTANTLLFLQILVAASITVLGAIKDHRARTATIFLGATNTVIAGLMTYFKSRNQPNRARQFRNDLGKVVDQLDDAEANFQNPNFQGNAQEVMQQIRRSYNTARADAEANYPDLWVKAGSLYDPMHPPQSPPAPDTTVTPPAGQQPHADPEAAGALGAGHVTPPSQTGNASAGPSRT